MKFIKVILTPIYDNEIYNPIYSQLLVAHIIHNAISPFHHVFRQKKKKQILPKASPWPIDMSGLKAQEFSHSLVDVYGTLMYMEKP